MIQESFHKENRAKYIRIYTAELQLSSEFQKQGSGSASGSKNVSVSPRLRADMSFEERIWIASPP